MIANKLNSFFDECVSKHTDLIPLYDEIGVYYFKQGDYLNAVQNYEKAAKFTLDEQADILTKKHT